MPLGLWFLPYNANMDFHVLASVLYALGYAAGIAAFVWLARRRGTTGEVVWNICAAGVLGGLVGAHAAQWLFAGQNVDALGGKSVLGAIAGGWLAVYVVKHRLGMTRPTGDLFLFGLCAGEAVGRWGCFLGGCCYGRPFAGAGAVWQHGAWRFPTQIYSSVACSLIFLLLCQLERTRPPVNMVFHAGGFLYAAARFAIEFFRAGNSNGLNAAQGACVVAIAYFGVKWVRLVRTTRGNYAPVS